MESTAISGSAELPMLLMLSSVIKVLDDHPLVPKEGMVIIKKPKVVNRRKQLIIVEVIFMGFLF
jgi:hypothetical protein